MICPICNTDHLPDYARTHLVKAYTSGPIANPDVVDDEDAAEAVAASPAELFEADPDDEVTFADELRECSGPDFCRVNDRGYDEPGNMSDTHWHVTGALICLYREWHAWIAVPDEDADREALECAAGMLRHIEFRTWDGERIGEDDPEPRKAAQFEALQAARKRLADRLERELGRAAADFELDS